MSLITDKVKNKVITALLNAYQDLLDYDGLNSILREAGLLSLKKERDVDPNQFTDLSILNKIITTQSLLLFGANDLLREIGAKFSFYLFPYGESIETIINQLPELISSMKIEVVNEKTNVESNELVSITFKIINCVFRSDVDQSNDFFIGFLRNCIEKSLKTKKEININVLDDKETELVVNFNL